VANVKSSAVWSWRAVSPSSEEEWQRLYDASVAGGDVLLRCLLRAAVQCGMAGKVDGRRNANEILSLRDKRIAAIISLC